jgi:hypothetical protein
MCRPITGSAPADHGPDHPRKWKTVAYAALITWFTTNLAGLCMLTVGLIENDVTDPSAQASRLSAPVVFSHLLLALTGLGAWAAYLILDRPGLAWGAVSILGLIALLGLAMFARWIPVHREPVLPTARAGSSRCRHSPPEGAFPLAVIISRGLLAASTAVLVLLTALGVGGS